jgi:hypothetical protein
MDLERESLGLERESQLMAMFENFSHTSPLSCALYTVLVHNAHVEKVQL